MDTHSKWAKLQALEKMGQYESIDWIKANTNQRDVILSNDFEGINYYTKRKIVWSGAFTSFEAPLESPRPLDYSGFMNATARLDISYVVLFKKSTTVGLVERITRDYFGDFVYDLSQGRGAPPNLEIIYDKEDAIIYMVKKGT